MLETSVNFNYNFIIIGASGYYTVGYHDVIGLENVNYFSSYVDGVNSCITRILIKLAFSPKSTKLFRSIFSDFVYNKIFPFKFHNSRPLCFIFFGTNSFLIGTKYLQYISNKYPHARKILYMQDIASQNKNLDLSKAQAVFDIIYSYDKGDCIRYGWKFWPTPYSIIQPKTNSAPYCDIFFCGKAKTRYKTVIDLFKICIKKGLKCIFFLPDVPMDDRVLADGLIYDKYISYEDNIKFVIHSKCVLEVMQSSADGYTPRLWESICFDKHLLTDNLSIQDSNFYFPDSIHFFNNGIENIEEWIDEGINYSIDLKKSLSPINFLKEVNSQLIDHY